MATLEQIVSWIADAGPSGWHGVPSMNIARVSGFEDAGPDTAVFAMAADALCVALKTQSGLILASQTAHVPEADARVLYVRDARLAFALLGERLARKPQSGIHPTASVDAQASLNADVTVGPGAVIGAGAVLGRECSIGARVVIEPGVILGERVRVQAGAVLGSLGFGYARRPGGSYVLFPQQGVLVIEDDVEIGANSTIDRGALGETRIGAGTKIDNLVHIGHNCRIGKNVILAAQTGISGSTIVEDGAILGGQVGIGEHALVGPGVILGGGAGVLSGKKLRGPGQVFWGRPAQPLKQYLRDLARLRRG